ncbi:MAG: DUF6503 family protein [Flavobacteriales bacterium]
MTDKKSLLAPLLLLLLTDCSSPQEKAQRIVKQAMEEHGVKVLKKDSVRFTFRDHRYTHFRNDGNFYYAKTPLEKGKGRRDLLTNKGFSRYKDGQLVELSKPDSVASAQSLNSVIYFAFLPYRLNDKAVIKEYAGTEKIKGIPYHRVRVSFKKRGGGADHEDLFLYWFRKKDARMDFFAYRYFRDEGGVRFRAAFDARKVEGLLIQSYKNYKGSKGTALKKLDERWARGELEKVSEIRTENVTVQ